MRLILRMMVSKKRTSSLNRNMMFHQSRLLRMNQPNTSIILFTLIRHCMSDLTYITQTTTTWDPIHSWHPKA